MFYHCSNYLKDFDPFGVQKEPSFLEWLPQISTLASYLTRLIAKPNQSQAELRVEFEHLLLVSRAMIISSWVYFIQVWFLPVAVFVG